MSCPRSDTSAPRHFGTTKLVPKCPDTSAPVFFGAELSRGHFGLVPNCLCALTRIRLQKTTRLYRKIVIIVLFKPLSTFKVVREPFRQLFSVHAFVKQDGQTKQVPLAFVLMTARRRIDYVRVWKALLNELPQPPADQAVISDFKAAQSAVREVFTGVAQRSCAFHYSQDAWSSSQRTPKMRLSIVFAKRQWSSASCLRASTSSPTNLSKLKKQPETATTASRSI